MARQTRPFFVICMLLAALSPLAAPLLASSHPLVALLLRAFFSRLCHQNPTRSFALYGSPVAVCVRCLGIYLGVALGGLLPAGRVAALRWFAFALLLNLLDVAAAMLGGHGNLPAERFCLGLLLGLSTGLLIFLPRRVNGPHESRQLVA